MADLSDIFGDPKDQPEPEAQESGFMGALLRSAQHTEDMERRSGSLRQAALLGPIAWEVYDRCGGAISMGQASEIALRAMREVSSETVTIVGYVQLTRRACQIAEEVQGEALTGTTQTGNVGDSREAAPEATEEPENL
jgi:hypothetical protein